MPTVELIMPRMGESVMEATIISWLKGVGDDVLEDETVVEVATDKVDTEVPSPFSGKIVKILHQVNDVVPVGGVLAVIETEEDHQGPQDRILTDRLATEDKTGSAQKDESDVQGRTSPVEKIDPLPEPIREVPLQQHKDSRVPPKGQDSDESPEDRFYSPLVRSIAKAEGIPLSELHRLEGTGGHGRLTKEDLLLYISLQQRKTVPPNQTQQRTSDTIEPDQRDETPPVPKEPHPKNAPADISGVVIEPMDRMRGLIANHMIRSQQISAHVTSFVETDVTNMVRWRNENKEEFKKQNGEKLTYTPLIIQSVVRALRDFPRINSSVVERAIHIKKFINIGMATALPNGNLIVPVIKNADELSLLGLSKRVNDLSERARQYKLSPEEVDGGTFTISNIGTFGNLMGTPIINQPEVSVLATGAIKKKPVVIESQGADAIAIRHMMFLSLSYDHRIIDGYYGGSFLNRIAQYIEEFDPDKKL